MVQTRGHLSDAKGRETLLSVRELCFFFFFTTNIKSNFGEEEQRKQTGGWRKKKKKEARYGGMERKVKRIGRFLQ